MSSVNGLRKLEQMDKMAKVIARGKHFVGRNRRDKLHGSLVGHNQFLYRVDLSWASEIELTPDSSRDHHEMVISKAGHIYVLTNDFRNNILILDPSGELIDTWTLGLEAAHGLTISHSEDEEMLFITDYKTQTVYKTTLWGQILMRIRAPEFLDIYSGSNAYLPTGTAVSKNGDVYIADGYGSSYIIQYDVEGRYISHFGGRGEDEESVNSSHGIAIDSRGAEQTLLVTSREDACIKRFTLCGDYIESINIPGAYMCRPVVHGENLYAAVCWSDKLYAPNTGFVTILNRDNVVVSNPGGIGPEYVDGKVRKLRQEVPLFSHCHDVCVDNDENVYVCEWNASGRLPVKLVRLH